MDYTESSGLYKYTEKMDEIDNKKIILESIFI
jgi:hypothetical protein